VIGIFALVALGSPDGRAEFMFPFTEDWESGSIDSAHWNSWGYPSPLLDNGANTAGGYSLDPNGDGSFHSGVVSAETFPLSGGVRVSIDTYIQSASKWSELTFGLANRTTIGTNPNRNVFSLAAVTIDADNQGTGHKLFTKFQSDNKNKTDYPSAKSGITSESVIDGWHTFVFDFASDGSAEVQVDGAITFKTSAGFYNYSTDDAFSVVLGGRSYGTTVNLYDSIRVHQVPEPTAFALLLVGGSMLLTIGHWRGDQTARFRDFRLLDNQHRTVHRQ
jgi:hypothetical protein